MIISKTPLRASFFGGGTDFAEYFQNSRFGYGSVLSAALNMHVYITVNKRFDDKIRVVYTGNEFVDSVEEVKHNIIREALKITGIEHGIEVVYMADLPMTNLGVGLASSSALAVGALNAIHAYKGEYVAPEQLAREAIDIEINRLGQQIGIQDQYAVSFGGFHRYKFHSDNTVTVTPVTLKESMRRDLVSHIQLFYTGRGRDSRKIFSEQRETTIKHGEKLDFLVEATEAAQKALLESNFDRWGILLDETWKVKKEFAQGISDMEIDRMYETAKENGAIGGKILGAGGGGFLLLYVPIEKKGQVRRALAGYTEVPFGMDMEGSRIIYAD